MINNYYNHLNLIIFTMPPRMNFGNNDQYQQHLHDHDHDYPALDDVSETDNESNGSYTDEEDDSEDSEFDGEYLPADSNKCYLALCELYYEKIHGSNDQTMNSQYLVIQRFSGNELSSHNLLSTMKLYSRQYKKLVQQNPINMQTHPVIKNYRNIISRDHYISPQIVKCVYFPGGECTAIIKTIWIKLIQRKWKNIFKERKRIICERSHASSIFYREIYGKWPQGLNVLPGIYGMLSQLTI